MNRDSTELETETRKCKKCEVIKPITYFTKEKTCTGGYNYTCKSCYAQKKRILYRVSTRDRITPEVRWEVWERDNFTCKKCGARKFLTIDHIYPACLGGLATVDNCQTLCKTCNRKKVDKIC